MHTSLTRKNRPVSEQFGTVCYCFIFWPLLPRQSRNVLTEVVLCMPSQMRCRLCNFIKTSTKTFKPWDRQTMMTEMMMSATATTIMAVGMMMDEDSSFIFMWHSMPSQRIHQNHLRIADSLLGSQNVCAFRLHFSQVRHTASLVVFLWIWLCFIIFMCQVFEPVESSGLDLSPVELMERVALLPSMKKYQKRMAQANWSSLDAIRLTNGCRRSRLGSGSRSRSLFYWMRRARFMVGNNSVARTCKK